MISKCETGPRAHTHRDNTIVCRMLETSEDSAEVGKTEMRRKGTKEMSQVFDC